MKYKEYRKYKKFKDERRKEGEKERKKEREKERKKKEKGEERKAGRQEFRKQSHKGSQEAVDHCIEDRCPRTKAGLMAVLFDCRSMLENKIEYLPDDSFSGNKQLTILRLKKNPIMSVGKYAFSNLPHLENL